jgi:hypothetical protein
MSSDDEEALLLITGAGCLKCQVLPLSSEADSDENEEPEEEELPKQREWKLMARFDVKDREPEDIDHLVFTECKKLMEASWWFRLSVGSQKQNSILLWRHSSFWGVANGSVRYQMLYCPMKGRSIAIVSSKYVELIPQFLLKCAEHTMKTVMVID